MFPTGVKKYDIGLEPPSPLWDEFCFLANIELLECSLGMKEKIYLQK